MPITCVRLGDLEAGVKNKLPFEEWQKAMRQKDLEADIAEVESRRLMGRLSYEEAILARQALTLENHNRVAEMKKEVKCFHLNLYFKCLIILY